jgi:hypothetical protein
MRGDCQEKGADAVDGEVLRKHIVAIGQLDPGKRPPNDQVGDDYKQADPE